MKSREKFLKIKEKKYNKYIYQEYKYYSNPYLKKEQIAQL